MAHINEKTIVSCEKCGAICCKHVALEIDKPTTKAEFDNIRWYLLHKEIEVFIDNDGCWNIKFETPCTQLDGKGRCLIYEDRPHLCMGYPPGNGECEYEGDDPYFRERFTSVGDFERYMDGRRKNWRLVKK
jgi:Fe-S-cluster containining protein